MTMTSYERFVAACEGRPVDRVPVNPFIMTFAARMAGVKYSDYCRDPEVLAQAQIGCIQRFGYDGVNATSDPAREAEILGAEVAWPDDDVPSTTSEPLLKGPDDLKKLHLPDPLARPGRAGRAGAPNRMRDQLTALKILTHELGPGEVVYGWVEAPFQEAAILRNLNYFMTDLFDNPAFVHELMRFATQMELEFGLAQIEAGARFIGVGDAVASLISPRQYQAFNYPYVKELVDGLKKASARVKYHACGNTRALLPLFAELGANILNLDSLVDLVEVKRMMGDRVCIKGNLDPVGVMLNGTPETVMAAARRCLLDAASGGRFILSPGCEVPRNTPPENLEALVRAARN